MTFAKFNAMCLWCGTAISQGDPIEAVPYWGFDAGIRWVHEECAGQLDRMKTE